MAKIVTCPPVATIASIVTSIEPCPVEIGQIQKLIFFRRGHGLTAVASATSATVWTAHLAATGDLKSVVSPMLTLNIPASEVREAGSGNEVVNGIPINIGSNPVKVEGRIWETDQATILKLKNIKSEYLDVMFVNEANQLIYKLSGTAVKGFPIKSLWVSDPAVGSFADGTYNMFSFYLEAEWANALSITTATTFLLDSVNS